MPSTSHLSIEPDELRFPFELNRQVHIALAVSNSTNSTVAFKVKTTAPQKYCVRPNRGVLHPFASRGVSIIMRSHSTYPDDYNSAVGCRDKFLVQSTIVPNPSEKSWETALREAQINQSLSDCRLHVKYIEPQQPPSPIKEEGDGHHGDSEQQEDNSILHTARDDKEDASTLSQQQEQLSPQQQQQQQLPQQSDFDRRKPGVVATHTQEFATARKAPPTQGADTTSSAIAEGAKAYGIEHPPEPSQRPQSSLQTREYSLMNVLAAAVIAFMLGMLVSRSSSHSNGA